MKYRIGRKLVGDRSAKAKLQEVRVTESKFADNVAVYATTREMLEQVAGVFVRTAKEWGLTVSLEKTKLLAVGRQLKPEDSQPVKLEEGEIATVEEFTYLGSSITSDGEVHSDVVARLGKASRAFGCLRSAVFKNQQLSTKIKREVYRAVVLSTLLYGAETWTVKAESVRRPRGFHNRCIWTIMGVSRLQQWKEKITSRELAESFGMTENMTEILRRHRLRWVGHMARMDDSRMPKQLLYGELVKPRPRHGTKRRWRDLAVADIQTIGVARTWYEVAQNRKEWAEICKRCYAADSESCTANSSNSDGSYLCSCGRSFRRQGDLKRHSRFCDGAYQLSRRQTSSSFECLCGRTFRRQGDLTRHSRFRGTT